MKNFKQKHTSRSKAKKKHEKTTTKRVKKNIERPEIYGVHAVSEAWLNPERNITKLYISEATLKNFEPLIKKSKHLDRPVPTIIDKSDLDDALHKDAVHQGIAICCSVLPELDEHDLVIRAKTRDKTVITILDQVTDPHNVGAILRSASAFGVHGVILQKRHAPVLGGVLAKIACGAVDHIDVAQATNLTRAICTLKEEGFFVIGLDEHSDEVIGATHNLAQHDKLVIILGSEGNGIRHLIKEHCDSIASLPTSGAIASLNVSNAAAVAFFALIHGVKN